MTKATDALDELDIATSAHGDYQVCSDFIETRASLLREALSILALVEAGTHKVEEIQ